MTNDVFGGCYIEARIGKSNHYLKIEEEKMEIKNVIYVAHVGELQDGKLANAYNEVCYTKKEAIHYCTEIVKKRLREIKEISLITAAELLRFMNDEEYHFNLTVTEYSTNRKEYEEPNGYAKDFVKYLKLGGPDLYEKLLETIVSNSYEIDYFGNVMEIYTNPEAYVGYTEGKMSEEDCKDGVYRGSFSYYGTTEQDIPFKMRKAYVMADVEVYREPLEDDLGFYAEDLSCYESLEECEEYAPHWLFSDLEFYLPLDEEGYCQDITEEQKLDLFHEKVYGYQLRVRNVSPNRIRFESAKELADYYAEKLSDGTVTADNFYDFLLSLVQYEERFYDYKGRLLRSRIKLQDFHDGEEYHIIPLFSYETARDLWDEQQKLKEKLYE